TIWLGRELAGRWLAPIEAGAAWAVGGAAALAGLIGLGCGLGLLGLLRPAGIWPAAALALLVALRLGRRRLIGDLRGLSAWLRRPAAARLDQQLLAGVVLLFGWLNLIGAL